MNRLGERVVTPQGAGIIIGFSRRREGWDVWGLETYDPLFGRVLLVDTAGPFFGVLIGDRILPVRPDDLGVAPPQPPDGLEVIPRGLWRYIRWALSGGAVEP